MIHYIHPSKHFIYSDRSYLVQWFLEDMLIVTDVDINQERNLQQLIDQQPCKNVLIDISHNQMPLREVPEFCFQYLILTAEWQDWYQPRHSNLHYFPLWLWMFSHRSNQFFQRVVFDAHGRKTLPMMCLNRNPHPHRARFRELMEPIRDQIIYTWGNSVLPGDIIDPSGTASVDISVGNPVYSQCAVNVVTESVMDRYSVSEKSVKPFVARQIPVLVGTQGINKFYTDLGLDMFGDLVPWESWDNEPDQEIRLQRIAEFVIDWYRRGTVLEDYQRVQHRVERNKQYFHSEQFRSVFLKRMPAVNAY